MGKYVNNNTITLGASYDLDDVVYETALVLGIGARTDGRYHIADICTAGSINKWAKNKPFRYNSDNFGYDVNNPSVANAERKRLAQVNNYGISIPQSTFGDALTMAKAVHNKTVVWEYDKYQRTQYLVCQIYYNGSLVNSIDMRMGYINPDVEHGYEPF